MTNLPTLGARISLAILSLVLGVTSIPTAFAQGVTVPAETRESAVSDNPVRIDNIAPLRPMLTYKVDMTAYNSEIGQTDADPFTAADGTTTYDGMVAANFLPFGTKVRIPELFGDKVFIVHDRMNRRYWHRVDVWMKEKPAAKKFGLHRHVKIEIMELGDGKTLYAKRAEAKRVAADLKKLEEAKVKSELATAKK